MLDHSAKRRKISPSPENGQNGNDQVASKNANKNASSITTSTNKRGKNDRTAELALASGFYKSSFFKLQMDELLTELRPNYDKQVSKIQGTLHKLKEIIERVPDREPKPALVAEKELRGEHGIAVPYPSPRPGKDTKYSVSYAKPTNVNVVGSFALRTGIRSQEAYTVDLAVTMPSSLFQEKDYVNHRYFHKRAYYIACLAAGIREANDLNVDVRFGFQDGDSLRPLVIVQPGENSDMPARSQIRIITAVDDKLFPIARTLPSKNNIRQGSSAEKPDHEQSTPFYNAALRSEATVALYHKYIYSASRRCEAYRDACVLGRTWLRQRGFGSSFQSGGFGGFEWTALMSLLFEGGGPNGKPILLPSYSSYQLFKATIQFLAGRDLSEPLLFFASDVPLPPGGPVLYDGKRGLNLLYKTMPWSYELLRHEATTTLRMLNESRDDNFEKVFILKVNEPTLRYDRLISLPYSDNGDVLQTIRHQAAVHEVVSKALGNRANLVSLSSRSIEPWAVGGKPSLKKDGGNIDIGLLLDSENASRVVDHGPSAEEKEEAASFRAFWGEKAELRRFKDGSILESLVWSNQPSSPSIVRQILGYILRRHFDITEQDIGYVGDEYDEKLRIGGDGIVSYNSPSFQLIANAFNSLERSIQSMDDVPLTIRQLAPASPIARYTALRAQNSDKPADIVLQFESSARWPDDLVAIQMTKIAFLLKIGDSLESSGAASSCRVGLENESSKILNNAFLDIIHETGVPFRLRIHHDREQTLLERQLKDKSISPRTKEEVAYALSVYKRHFIQSPRFTQAIRTLCTRFPLLSPTIRLVKYWFNSHLFAGHVNEELIELLTVRTFTQPYPWEAPSSVMAGFLRTLHFLSRWDWQQEPLIVDLGGELNQDVIETIRTRFSAWRSIDPAMNAVVMFAASDVDTDGVTWTQYEAPPKVVAARMSTLAKAAMKLLREQGHDLDISSLFQTSLAPYDFILNLRSKLFSDRSSSTKFKNLTEYGSQGRLDKLAIVKSFVGDIQACYSESLLLFHGEDDCRIIAGLWNPQTAKPRSFNLKTAYSTSPVYSKQGHSDQVSINHPAILNEIARLGTSLIDGIEIQKA
ncbi:hypothetical protein SI65_06199 [Aspergillus cristatus]|uniref:U3 small nucleolar RNA-associated protein 22 n=1 Tax=Aspergillus cristatus TaxID=573508 RepID=A0A1E3BBS0_ASPCR|nr:hypothetical protein SI65_06199 [Aspergillus cristatus]